MTGDVEAALLPLLDGDELARSERLRFDWLRRRFTVAHAMARLVLAEHLGADPCDLRFEAGPHGKPNLAGGGVEFNLSHSADRAVIALRSSGPVGIDVEALRELSHVEQVAERILSAVELEEFAGADDAHRFVLAKWTCKEAVVKQSGDGITRSLREIDGSVCTPLDVGPGFLGALAADGAPHSMRTWVPPSR